MNTFFLKPLEPWLLIARFLHDFQSAIDRLARFNLAFCATFAAMAMTVTGNTAEANEEVTVVRVPFYDSGYPNITHEPAHLATEMLAPLCEPAVFPILEFLDLDLSYPREFSVKEQLIKDQFRSSGQSNYPAFAWQAVVADPGRFLEPSDKRTGEQLKGREWASGTCFAVNEDGVLVTNAHVVSAPTEAEVLNNAEIASNLFGNAFGGLVQRVGQILGGDLPDNIGQESRINLFKWFLRQAHCSAKLNKAEVVIKAETGGNNQARLTTFPAKVLAIGGPISSKGENEDIAILQIDDPSVRGKLICLQLGRDGDVLPGSYPIHTFGFPGGAFIEGLLAPAAEFSMSVTTGELGELRPTLKDWSVYEMSADINHGDSGGPVVNSEGRVVAVSVAVTDISSHALAVPVDVVWKFLIKAGLNSVDARPGLLIGTPRVNSITLKWKSGIEQFQVFREEQQAFIGHKTTNTFAEVNNLQSGTKILPEDSSKMTENQIAAVDTSRAGVFANRYVLRAYLNAAISNVTSFQIAETWDESNYWSRALNWQKKYPDATVEDNLWFEVLTKEQRARLRKLATKGAGPIKTGL